MSSSPFYTEEVFRSSDELTDWVQNIARRNGFVIVKYKTKSEKGYLYSIIYGCSKGGVYRHAGLEDEVKRQTSTSKTNFPLRLVAKYSKTQDFWRLRVKCDSHNHDFAESLHGFPYAMRLRDDEFGLVEKLTEYHVSPRHILSSVKDLNPNNVSGIRTIYNAQNKIRGAPIGDRTPIQVLYSHLQHSGYTYYEKLTEYHVPPRHILSSVKDLNPNNVSGIRTIYNAQNKIRGALIGDRTPIQVLYSHLQHSGYTYYERVNELTNELEELFFVHPTSYALCRTFPEIMLMDSTYNTTLFKLPFSEIVGLTPTNKTFSMAFCFLDKEKGPNFRWVLQCVKEVIEERYYPRVITTDRDLALVGACREEFPNANKLLCQWHIYQNVLQYCRPRCKTLKEYESIKGTWDWMVKAPTCGIFMQYYQHLQDLLDKHADISLYLNNWLNGYSDMFISFITDQYRSFGQSTTCRVEGQHALLKLYLGSTMSNLDTLLSSVDKILVAQETAIKETLNRSKNERINKCNIPLFQELWYKVSKYALELISNELQLSIDAQDCTHQLRSVYGLPCFHELLYYQIHNMAIPLDAVDIFWRTLFVPWPSINTEAGPSCDPDNDPDCEDDIQQFRSVFGKVSSFVKKSMLKKVRGIYNPESVDTRQPAVHTSTRGRPSAKDKKSQATKVLDLNKVPTVDHRRSTNSISIKVPDLNKQPARHSSYMGPRVERSPRHGLYVRNTESEYFIKQLPQLFRRYIISIYNVEGDGNCGFWCVAHRIGQTQENWLNVRRWLLQELEVNRDFYMGMWCQRDYDHLLGTLNWLHDGPCPVGYWMLMPNTGLVIATVTNRHVVFISGQQSFTCFPLFYGPDLSQGAGPLVIARVGSGDCGHYIHLTLDENSPFPTIHPQWRYYRVAAASGWETLSDDQLHLYNKIRQTQT